MVLHSKIMFSLKFYTALKKYFLVITDFVNNHNKKVNTLSTIILSNCQWVLHKIEARRLVQEIITWSWVNICGDEMVIKVCVSVIVTLYSPPVFQEEATHRISCELPSLLITAGSSVLKWRDVSCKCVLCKLERNNSRSTVRSWGWGIQCVTEKWTYCFSFALRTAIKLKEWVLTEWMPHLLQQHEQTYSFVVLFVSVSFIHRAVICRLVVLDGFNLCAT